MKILNYNKYPTISIILSTYNSVKWLEKVLWSYSNQTYLDFELIIADDGSTKDTSALIENFSSQVPFKVIHLWQEDKGFRKCKILNKAILNSNAEYIIMSDGDCIVRSDFVETHKLKSEKGYFLSGGYFKLSLSISKIITKEDIENQNCFSTKWLLERGLKKNFKINKLNSRGLKQYLLNTVTPTKATWNGHNSSGWKSDIIDINGFNEKMKYGGEDREFGERLLNKGIKSKQIRYSAICLHLDHSRSYINDVDLTNNNNIRKETRNKNIVRTPYGLDRYKI